MKHTKKLIEVALPLDAINAASAREKSIRHGHPSTLHLWWARRPLAAARAVIFAQMVDDPSEYTDQLLSDPKLKRKAESELKRRLKRRETADKLGEEAEAPEELTLEACVADQERERLFRLIEELVTWENTTNENVIQQARDEIWASWRRTCAANADHPQAKELFDRHKLPAFHDPFAGGGALPLEAQRLGLEAWASDLNPVAVLINKAMIEIPPKFAGMEPVNPEWRQKSDAEKMGREWKGAQGLAEDVRYYGQWMRDEAAKRIGHLYPKVKITAEMVAERPDLKPYLNRELTVIAWIWARTVKSPNPAFSHVDVPLASTFMLSTKQGKEAYVEPLIEGDSYRFTVKVGKPKDVTAAKAGTKLSRGANFECLISGTPMTGDYIRAEGKAGRISTRLLALVVKTDNMSLFLSPSDSIESVAKSVASDWAPDQEFVKDARAFTPSIYGMNKWSHLYTNRQVAALTAYTDLIHEVSEHISEAVLTSDGVTTNSLPIKPNSFELDYTSAIMTYLSFAVDKCADYWNTCCTWMPRGTVGHLFARHAIPMTWDFPEANPLSSIHCAWHEAVNWVAKSIDKLPGFGKGTACQQGASSQVLSTNRIVSTDPPYYDNVPYADLSDFFYVWLRKSLKSIYPDLFPTIAVPKKEELVVTSYRHGSKKRAEIFFLDGMTKAMGRLSDLARSDYPVTIYYAFKQVENDSEAGTTNTGWEVFLDAVIQAGLSISGTWPIRTEREARSRGIGSNALASSVVLVCRKREKLQSTVSRKVFLVELKSELPPALRKLQRGNIAPVDMAQAAIGPGMAVYSRYRHVLDAAGEAISVKQALALINEVLDETLAEQEGDFDADSRLALAWFEQFGFEEGPFGVAETLSKAKNSSVSGLEEAGVWKAGKGKVCLLTPEQLSSNWDPSKDKRLTVWEMVHHLLRALTVGESDAGRLLAKLGPQGETARELAYRLYSLCERKKWAKEALGYNSLVQSWPELQKLAEQVEIREQASFL